MPRDITPDDFAALSADLRERIEAALAGAGLPKRGILAAREAALAERLPPILAEACRERPWARRRVVLREAARLAGMSPEKLRKHDRRARKTRAAAQGGYRLFPAEHPRGGWRIADVAAWHARSDQAHTPPPPRPADLGELAGRARRIAAQRGVAAASRASLARELGLGANRDVAARVAQAAGVERRSVTDAEAAAFARGLAAARGQPVTAGELAAEIRARGHVISAARAARVLGMSGAKNPVPDYTGLEPGAWEPMTKAGAATGYLLTPEEVARAAGVSPASVRLAVRTGRLRRVPGMSRIYLDRRDVRMSTDGAQTPVHKDHPAASPVPLLPEDEG